MLDITVAGLAPWSSGGLGGLPHRASHGAFAFRALLAGFAGRFPAVRANLALNSAHCVLARLHRACRGKEFGDCGGFVWVRHPSHFTAPLSAASPRFYVVCFPSCR
jgi:hypothetical protein